MSPQNQPVYLRLTIRDIENNHEVFLSNENETNPPLEILPGQDMIFPKVDELLQSMNVGDRKTLTLNKEDAFGDVVKEAIQQIPLDQLPQDLQQAGLDISAQTENGQPVQGTVISIDDQFAVIDFNHPLAGKPVEVEFVLVEKP